MRVRALKVLVFGAALGPFAFLVSGLFNDGLGTNPVETITDETGTWALRFLVLTLAVTPVRRWTGWHALVRFRRMLGLFACFYATLHVLTYVWLDQLFDLRAIVDDVVKRPFIAAGAIAFLLMLPLAVTSTAGWIRRLGGRRWQVLHWLVYPSAIAAVVHYFWLVRLETDRPVRYAVVLGLLLGARVWFARARFGLAAGGRDAGAAAGARNKGPGARDRGPRARDHRPEARDQGAEDRRGERSG